MPERKFADSYEMNIKEIHNAITQYLFDLEYFDLFNSEDEEREQALENRINNIMGLDERFKSSFNNDMQIAMNLASCNGFENGLRIGLSLLKNLLTAEPPEIHIFKHEPDRTERRCKPVHQPSDVDPVFIDYIKKVCPYLKDEQKFILQGRAEYLFEKNIKEYLDIF